LKIVHAKEIDEKTLFEKKTPTIPLLFNQKFCLCLKKKRSKCLTISFAFKSKAFICSSYKTNQRKKKKKPQK
jgi:hypothetical protein